MKIEIEITESEIRSAIERKVRTAIADQTNQWNVDAYIKDRVKTEWKEVADAMIREELNNASVLKEKITAAIEAKLKGQITALMKGQK